MGAILKAINTKASSRGSSSNLEDYLNKDKSLKTGIDCNSENWEADFSLTKAVYSKTEGRQYKHFAQSFEKDCKLTSEEVHQSGIELVNSCKQFKGFQAVVVTHIDKEHLHNHIVVNSVSLENGKKLQLSNSNLKTIKNNMDKYLEKTFNLAPTVSKKGIVKTQSTNTHKVLEKALEGKYESFLLNTTKDIQESIGNSRNFEELEKNLSKKNIKIDVSNKHSVLMFENQNGKKLSSKKIKTALGIDFSKTGLEKEFNINLKAQELDKIDYTKIKMEAVRTREIEEKKKQQTNTIKKDWIRKSKQQENTRGGM